LSRAAALFALALFACAAPRAAAREPIALELFVRAGCPHCEKAEAFVETLAARHPELRVERRDVAADPDALARLLALAEAAGVQPAVPAFHSGGRLLVGFRSAETTGRELEALLLGTEGAESDTIELPLVGRVRAGELGLPLFTLAIGLVDGLNPCAMWVLLFLLSLLVHLRSRRRMWIVGGTFVAVSGLVYFAFLAAWLNVFLFVGLARAVQLALGSAAIAMGAVHLKDALAPGRGPSLRIPEAARPRIYARVRRVLYAENLAGALAAVAVLALLVNAVELLCTAGLPALYTRVLTFHDLPAPAYYAHLALYVAAYVFDDALVLAAATTLGGRKLQERQGRWLNAASGALLLALGVLVVLRPEWLGRIGG
jgi:hypothetical protein